jgi:ribosomal protein L21
MGGRKGEKVKGFKKRESRKKRKMKSGYRSILVECST